MKGPLCQAQECWEAMSPVEQGIRWLLIAIVHGAMREQGWRLKVMASSTHLAETWTGPAMVMRVVR